MPRNTLLAKVLDAHRDLLQIDRPWTSEDQVLHNTAIQAAFDEYDASVSASRKETTQVTVIVREVHRYPVDIEVPADFTRGDIIEEVNKTLTKNDYSDEIQYEYTLDPKKWTIYGPDGEIPM